MQPSLTIVPTAAENNFGDVKLKNSSEEALQQWQRVCGFVKNPKRKFRFAANQTKRSEAKAMRKANQEKLRVSGALQFKQEHTVTDEVEAAGFQICADELGSIFEGHDVKKLKVQGGVEGVANTLATSTTNGIGKTDDELKCRRAIYGINWFTKAQQAWKAWKHYFSLLPHLSISSSLSIPLNLLLPFDPSISLLSLDLSPLISRLFPTSQQDTSSSSSASPSSSSPASLPCCSSSSQERFVPLQHLCNCKTESHATLPNDGAKVCIITDLVAPMGEEFYEAPLAEDFVWGSGDVVVLLEDGEPALGVE